MKTRLITSMAIALLLIAVLSLPAVAVDVWKSAYVNVNSDISVTLADAGASGIQFGSVDADGSTHGDSDQSDGTPAIGVDVDSNVSVNISIMGTTTDTLALDNWKYSTQFDQSDIASVTGSFVKVYEDVGTETYAVYHWITIPADTTAGSYSANITYRVDTG